LLAAAACLLLLACCCCLQQGHGRTQPRPLRAPCARTMTHGTARARRSILMTVRCFKRSSTVNTQHHLLPFLCSSITSCASRAAAAAAASRPPLRVPQQQHHFLPLAGVEMRQLPIICITMSWSWSTLMRSRSRGVASLPNIPCACFATLPFLPCPGVSLTLNL